MVLILYYLAFWTNLLYQLPISHFVSVIFINFRTKWKLLINPRFPRLRRTPESWRSWARGSPAPAWSAADTPAARTETQTPAQVRKYLLFLKNICIVSRVLFSAGGQRPQGAGEVEAGRQEGAAAVGPGSGLPPARGWGEKRRKYYNKIFFKLKNIFWANIFNQWSKQVRDFGPSWRDGTAFIAVVNSIRPGKGSTGLLLQWRVSIHNSMVAVYDDLRDRQYRHTTYSLTFTAF